MSWACLIEDCATEFGSVEDLIVHQASEHERCECKVCGTVVPEGYLAIRHAFEEHTRAEYVRAYDASSDDIRKRENVKEHIEEQVDVDDLVARLEADAERSPVSAD